MATDWAALRIEYVNGAMQYKELAETHGLKEGTVRVRAHREGWAAERDAVKRDVTQRATEAATTDKAARLAKFNEQDIKIAEALKARAVELLRGDVDDRTLNNLRGVFEGAQRIGRLALGAETEMSIVKTQELPSSVDDFV